MRMDATHNGTIGVNGVGDEAPVVIAPNHRIVDVLAWFPASMPVLKKFGIAAPAVSLFGRLFGRQLTVARAAQERGISLDAVLLSLNEARPQLRAEDACRGCGNCECGKRRAAAQVESVTATVREAHAR